MCLCYMYLGYTYSQRYVNFECELVGWPQYNNSCSTDVGHFTNTVTNVVQTIIILDCTPIAYAYESNS